MYGLSVGTMAVDKRWPLMEVDCIYLFTISFGPSRNRKGIDIHAMVDAIAAVMAMEDKEFYKVGELAVAVMIETATAITGDAYKVTTS